MGRCWSMRRGGSAISSSAGRCRRSAASIEALAEPDLLRYDKPGCGLSGPAGQPHSMELELQTLAAVIRASGAERFDLLGISLGAPVAVRWAAAHPQSVSRLVLSGGWVRGQEISSPDVQELVLGLVAKHWGLGSAVLGDDFAPGADAATRAAFTGYMREAASPETARSMLALSYQVDVSDALSRIQARARSSYTGTPIVPRRRGRAGRCSRASPGLASICCPAVRTFRISAMRTRSPG